MERYARVLQVPPEYILTGLWPDDAGEKPLADLILLYRDLDSDHRRALLSIGGTLRELQSGYSTEEPEKELPVVVQDMAAFDERDVERHVAEESDPWPE